MSVLTVLWKLLSFLSALWGKNGNSIFKKQRIQKYLKYWNSVQHSTLRPTDTKLTLLYVLCSLVRGENEIKEHHRSWSTGPETTWYLNGSSL